MTGSMTFQKYKEEAKDIFKNIDGCVFFDDSGVLKASVATGFLKSEIINSSIHTFGFYEGINDEEVRNDMIKNDLDLMLISESMAVQSMDFLIDILDAKYGA
jgi:hypothetical protein